MTTEPRSAGFGPWAEWAVWLGLAAIAWAQTGYFDQEIQEYRFGADGWPKAICIVLALGATGQLLLNLRSKPDAGDEESGTIASSSSYWIWIQRLGVFILPLIYLYLMPSLGFYVLTPIFIALLLILLEVHKPHAILAVTAIVYGLVLLIFTRLFFVALPAGNAQPFYDWNNAIIVFARMGL